MKFDNYGFRAGRGRTTTGLVAFLLLTLLPFFLSAQTRSAIPAPTQNSKPETQNSTRAVVVGISNYQHNAIPDLMYAHQDAQAFADWLKSPAGGNVPEQNITLLTNAGATYAAVGTALYSMLDVCKPGERFIFYFSGHGDVEAKISTQPGYLLCHDSPANVYMVGAFNLRDLQLIVSTLSENGVKVVLVTDACHAGKLAGAGIGGTQATAAALSKQIANEVKIMSCQPNEFSLEGEQWGGGAFSANLLDGLTGLSDLNNNNIVNLFEITRYLQDNVPTQTAPLPQMPMSVGDLQTALNAVDAASLARLKTKKSGAVAGISAVGSKGLEEEILAKTDSLTRQRYLDFKKQIAKHVFFEPRYDCADDLFRELIRLPQLQPLHGLMTRNYAVALLDEVQQAINALLDNDPYEANTWQYNPEKYSHYPDYLQRTIELLGEKHYMVPSLMSKKRYFEGYNISKTLVEHQKQPALRDSLLEAAKKLYLQGIAFEPGAAYLYHAIGNLYITSTPLYTDSLLLWSKRSIELSPGWVTPYLLISWNYGNGEADFEKARQWIDRALEILPNSYLIQERLGFLLVDIGKREEAITLANKMIAERPELFNAYTILSFLYYFEDGDFLAVDEFTKKSLERNPSPNNWALNFWAGIQVNLHPLPEAIENIRKSLVGSTDVQRGYRGAFLIEALAKAKRFDEAEAMALQLLSEDLAPMTITYILQKFGEMRIRQGRLEEAAGFFQKSLVSDPTPDAMFISNLAWLGEIARLQHRNAEAEAFYQKALAYHSGYGVDLGLKEEAWYIFGHFLLDQNRLSEAEHAFQQSLDLRRKGFWGEYGFALLAARKGEKQEALDWLEKSLENHFRDQEAIYSEPLFTKLRKTIRFKALLAKHFPETTKH